MRAQGGQHQFCRRLDGGHLVDNALVFARCLAGFVVYAIPAKGHDDDIRVDAAAQHDWQPIPQIVRVATRPDVSAAVTVVVRVTADGGHHIAGANKVDIDSGVDQQLIQATAIGSEGSGSVF